MAGWLHGVFEGEWLFVFPLCGFSLSLFCNYVCMRVQCMGLSEIEDTLKLHVHTDYVTASGQLLPAR